MAHAGAPDLVALQPEQLAQLADMLRAGAGGAGTTRLRRMTEATPGVSARVAHPIKRTVQSSLSESEPEQPRSLS